MGIIGPCRLGRLHRDRRRVLCFADWSKEYGVPAWFTRNGYVKDVRFCLNSCEKRPGIVEVELEGGEGKWKNRKRLRQLRQSVPSALSALVGIEARPIDARSKTARCTRIATGKIRTGNPA